MAISLPFTFANGTVADANQVNSNFNALLGGINIGGPAAGQPWSVAQGGTGSTSQALPTNFKGTGYGIVWSSGNSVEPSPYWSSWGDGGLIGQSAGNVDAASNYIALYRSRGTMAAPQPVLTGDELGGISFSGYPDTDSATSAMGARATENHSSTAHGSNLYFTTTPNGTAQKQVAMTLGPEGNLTVIGTITPSTSDIRMKEAVLPFTGGGLDVIRALRPISWQWNGRGGKVKDGTRNFGLSADDVALVLPEAIGVRPPLGIEDEEKYKTLDYQPVICALITAVQQLAAKIDK
jgi:hypothetical protein